MPLSEAFPPVRERDVELDDEMPVTGQVDRTADAIAPLDDTRKRERGEKKFYLLGLIFFMHIAHETIVTARHQLRPRFDRMIA